MSLFKRSTKNLQWEIDYEQRENWRWFGSYYIDCNKTFFLSNFETNDLFLNFRFCFESWKITRYLYFYNKSKNYVLRSLTWFIRSHLPSIDKTHCSLISISFPSLFFITFNPIQRNFIKGKNISWSISNKIYFFPINNFIKQKLFYLKIYLFKNEL